MILGLFQNAIDAEIALNNLAEADFNSPDISVIMDNTSAVKKIADESGVLSGKLDQKKTAELRKLGLSQPDIDSFQAGVSQGGVIIIIAANADSEAAGKEILADQKAKIIKVIDSI